MRGGSVGTAGNADSGATLAIGLGEKASGLMERPELHGLAIGAVAADFGARYGDLNLAIVFDLLLELLE